ncbi:hypothetical protein Syun_025906 [Stephania yunnanensis]|uniref:Uncharacterized protein n=1 Tax=Stephania yunnanensis TaxID=152371 RepID=A0AAP0ETA8_9MAGN
MSSCTFQTKEGVLGLVLVNAPLRKSYWLLLTGLDILVFDRVQICSRARARCRHLLQLAILGRTSHHQIRLSPVATGTPAAPYPSDLLRASPNLRSHPPDRPRASLRLLRRSHPLRPARAVHSHPPSPPTNTILNKFATSRYYPARCYRRWSLVRHCRVVLAIRSHQPRHPRSAHAAPCPRISNFFHSNKRFPREHTEFSQPDIELAIMSLWCLWNHRNKLLFEGKFIDAITFRE